jgi:hypothetical protein
MTPDQERRRERFEALIGAMAPLLDLVLAIGGRISGRKSEPSGPESYPIRRHQEGAHQGGAHQGGEDQGRSGGGGSGGSA